MKILLNFNNKQKMYIQIQDLLYLKKMNIKMPESICERIIKEQIEQRNMYDYLEFHHNFEIAFLNNQDFIANYADYEDLTLEQIYAKAEELGNKLNEIKNNYNKMSDDEKNNNQDYQDYINQLEYKLNSIAFIHSIKRKNSKQNKVKTKYSKRDK